MALLSIEAADVQVDCLHRLVAGLCAAQQGSGVELLCRLPWAHNLLVGAGWWVLAVGAGWWVLAVGGCITHRACMRLLRRLRCPSCLPAPPGQPPRIPPTCLPACLHNSWSRRGARRGCPCLKRWVLPRAGRAGLCMCITAAPAAAAVTGRCRGCSLIKAVRFQLGGPLYASARASALLDQPAHATANCRCQPTLLCCATDAQVVATLQRRAAQLDLRAAPQPYKVGAALAGLRLSCRLFCRAPLVCAALHAPLAERSRPPPAPRASSWPSTRSDVSSALGMDTTAHPWPLCAGAS